MTYVECGDIVEIETRCRIAIWRTFGRIQWRVIPEPHATLHGLRIPSAILKILFRHILFYFLMQFGLWRAAAFVSSPIDLLKHEKGNYSKAFGSVRCGCYLRDWLLGLTDRRRIAGCCSVIISHWWRHSVAWCRSPASFQNVKDAKTNQQITAAGPADVTCCHGDDLVNVGEVTKMAFCAVNVFLYVDFSRAAHCMHARYITIQYILLVSGKAISYNNNQ